MQMREFFHNFAKRVVILLIRPKGRKVTKRPSIGGFIKGSKNLILIVCLKTNVFQKAEKIGKN